MKLDRSKLIELYISDDRQLVGHLKSYFVGGVSIFSPGMKNDATDFAR